jgi:hypothetical protein
MNDMYREQQSMRAYYLSTAMAVGLLATMLIASPASAQQWAPLDIIDVNMHPLDENPRFGARSKSVLYTPTGGSLIYAEFSPSWNMNQHYDRIGPHYHHWNEWAYILRGDFVIHEPVTPGQVNPPVYRFTEGTWLDRPAYSLHGGHWETGGIRSQNPVIMLLFEEGDGSVVTLGEQGDHFKPDFPDSRPQPYLPDWRVATDFPRAWIVNTAHEMEWENDPTMPGRMVKWLSDNRSGGFRAQLVKIPPRWTPPAGTLPTYYDKGHVLRYMLYGSMNVWQFDGRQPGEVVEVGENVLVHQRARGIWGYGEGPITQHGAVWLEVTYAGELEHGHGPIPEPGIVE